MVLIGTKYNNVEYQNCFKCTVIKFNDVIMPITFCFINDATKNMTIIIDKHSEHLFYLLSNIVVNFTIFK